MLIFIIITLAYCQDSLNHFQPKDNETYFIRNIATSFYLSNVLVTERGWFFNNIIYDIFSTSCKHNSEWVFNLQNITYNALRVYTIHNKYDNSCIDMNMHRSYDSNIYLNGCNHGAFQYWIIEELEENRKRLKSYVEQMYISSNTIGNVYLKENLNKAYQQWYIEKE